MADADALYPACVAMYTEEVGISPESGGGADLYRTRVHQLVSRGWSFARIEDGEVVFKAEVAVAHARTPPGAGRLGRARPARARGWAPPGWPPSSTTCSRDLAPVVSLYVNDYNYAARRVYERVGFRQTATFATVMF